MASPILTEPTRNNADVEGGGSRVVAPTTDTPDATTSGPNKGQDSSHKSFKSRVLNILKPGSKSDQSSKEYNKGDNSSFFYRKRTSIAGQAAPGKAIDMKSNLPGAGNHVR